MDDDAQHLETVRSFVKKYAIAEFTPCAYFIDNLDEIVVLTDDCSFTQHCVSDHICIFTKNHDPDVDCCIGMSIKGVRHFLTSFGITPPASWKIQDLVEVMARHLNFTILGSPKNREIIHHILDEYGELAVPSIPA